MLLPKRGEKTYVDSSGLFEIDASKSISMIQCYRQIWVPLKTFQDIAGNFYWPKMREEIFDYVHWCYFCHRVKPAQNTRVGYIQLAQFPNLWRGCSKISWARLLARSEVILRSWKYWMHFPNLCPFPCPENLMSGSVCLFGEGFFLPMVRPCQ